MGTGGKGKAETRGYVGKELGLSPIPRLEKRSPRGKDTTAVQTYGSLPVLWS